MPIITTDELLGQSNQSNTISTEELLGNQVPRSKGRVGAFDRLTGKILTGKDVAITPEQIGQAYPVIGRIMQGLNDAIVPFTHFANQSLLNLPRSLSNKMSVDYPTETSNPVMQKIAQGAGIAGAFTSAPLNALSTLGRGTAIATAPLRYKALAGLLTGAAYSPTENPLDLKQRAFQGAMGATTMGGGALLAKGVKNIPMVINKIRFGGLVPEEAARITRQYGNSTGSLSETAKNLLTDKGAEANYAYKNAVDNFTKPSFSPKGGIVSNIPQVGVPKFFNTLRNDLLEKGWITEQGIPTTRYKNGLGSTDRLNDQLTNMFIDIKDSGKLISKSDFSRFRDNLTDMGWDSPSVQKAKNALYNDAENSGMTGIKKARDLESQYFKMKKKFLTSNGELKIATEKKLAQIGTKNPLSQQDIQNIKQLQEYIKHPILKDAESINRLNRAREILRRAKVYGGGVVAGATAGEVGRKLVTGRF